MAPGMAAGNRLRSTQYAQKQLYEQGFFDDVQAIWRDYINNVYRIHPHRQVSMGCRPRVLFGKISLFKLDTENLPQNTESHVPVFQGISGQ